MSTIITQAFTREERKNYVKIGPEFDAEARVRQLAFAASAMLQWIDHAKAKFSVSTAERYLESLYWDPTNPDRIVMGVFPNTLADLLEEGQDPRDLNSIFLRKAKLTKDGRPYKVIPIDDTGDGTRAMQYVASGMPLSVSSADISYYMNNMTPKIAALSIKGKMGKFDKSRIRTHSFKPAGKFLVNKKSQKFRTVTSASSPNTDKINKPADIWKHPGIRAALIGDKVSAWMTGNRANFIAPIFNKEPGFLI